MKFSDCNLVCKVGFVILSLFTNPIFGYLKFDLSHEEANEELDLYSGHDANELMNLCRLANGTHDFLNPSCIANIVFIQVDPTDELAPVKDRAPFLKEIRRDLLQLAIYKTIGFKQRLSWPPFQFIIQMIGFFTALFGGIFLWVVGHFDMRSHHVQFFKDPTKGMPGKVYVAKANNYWIHYWPPPADDDKNLASYVFEESDPWSTERESEEEEEEPRIVVPEQKVGGAILELTPEELEYIRKNAEFDDFGYPFVFKDVDISGDEKLVREFDAQIEAANAIVLEARSHLPIWKREKFIKYDYRETLLQELEAVPGYSLLTSSEINETLDLTLGAAEGTQSPPHSSEDYLQEIVTTQGTDNTEQMSQQDSSSSNL